MKKNICFVTLGCAKNTVYSEYMMGLVTDSDYMLVEEPAEAHVIVVNTCGFITAAKEETINTILALNDYKEAGSCDFLVAIGCMVQKYASEMAAALPELDLLLGSTAYDEILALRAGGSEGRGRQQLAAADGLRARNAHSFDAGLLRLSDDRRGL